MKHTFYRRPHEGGNDDWAKGGIDAVACCRRSGIREPCDATNGTTCSGSRYADSALRNADINAQKPLPTVANTVAWLPPCCPTVM